MAITGTPGSSTGPDGEQVFTKTLADAPPLFFQREAAGLRALRAAGARVPEVLDVTDEAITLSWVEQGGQRTAAGEGEFGRELAILHRTSAERLQEQAVQSTPIAQGEPMKQTAPGQQTFGSVDGEPTA